MKYVILMILVSGLSWNAAAQTTAVTSLAALTDKDKPLYPGGDTELKKYLCLNLRYPNEAIEKHIQGEVIVSFLIDEQGRISDIAATKGIGYGCDEEAVRVVKAMPPWQPGRRNGKAVKVTYNLPVVFELQPGVSDK